MKKILLLMVAMLMCGAMFAQSAPKMPRYLYVAGQRGDMVKVYNCKTKEIKSVKGYLRNVGVDTKGNVYVLVCDESHGWGNYYVYKNCNASNPYMSFKWNQKEGIYSSGAMKVKGDKVVVSLVQSLGFNDKGYQSRMVGYIGDVRVFQTEYERKSLKREEFKGYKKLSGSGPSARAIPYDLENKSGNPQGDHLSCVFHIDAVDYSNGFIYATGWGEREYTETPVGYQTQYFVRRCPRVWKNGAQVVEQYQNRTGAAWNISVFNTGGQEYIFSSGHQRCLSCAWEHNVDQFNDSESIYPGIISEATFLAGSNDKGPIFCRAYLSTQKNGKTMKMERYMQNGKALLLVNGETDNMVDMVAIDKGYYLLTILPNGDMDVHYYKNFVYNDLPSYHDVKTACTVPSSLGITNPKLAVLE